MEYNLKGLVVYIDLLGTKESSFDALHNISKIFRKELLRLGSRQMFCKKFVTSFSDCAYIIYETNEHDGDNEKDAPEFDFYIHDSLIDLAYTISTIQVNGFMCRGGISYGELYCEKNSNIIFGPAINEAYTLETEAIMPRIILNDKLGNKFYKKESTVIKDKFQKLIRKDEYDNRYYLNYLYAFSQFDDMDYGERFFNEKIKLGDKEYNFDEYYDILEKYSMDTIKNKCDHKIIAKHKWQLRYLKQYHNERESLSY
jgi:hypothetical protein